MLIKFIADNLKIVLVLFILVTRIIDIINTYVISPRLMLETNPVVRKAKWPAGILTLLLAAAPLLNIHLGIVILAMSLISSSLNIRKIWMMKTIGEENYLKTIIECVKANGILRICFFEFLSTLFWLFLALFLILLNRENNSYVFWFAVSLGGYGLLSFVYYMSYIINVKKKYTSLPQE